MLSINERKFFNGLMKDVLSNLLSSAPDYYLAKEKLSIALSYYPESEDIKQLIKECDDKLTKRLKYNNMLREFLKESKTSGHTNKAIDYYIKSIELDPILELNKQYNDFMIKEITKKQLNGTYDNELNEIIIQAMDCDINLKYSQALDLWSRAFNKKKLFAFFKKILDDLIHTKQITKAGLFLNYIINNHPNCLRQIEFDNKQMEWVYQILNKLINNWDFVKSHIDKIENKMNSANNLKKTKELKLSKRKLKDIENTLQEFLLSQF